MIHHGCKVPRTTQMTNGSALTNRDYPQKKLHWCGVKGIWGDHGTDECPNERRALLTFVDRDSTLDDELDDELDQSGNKKDSIMKNKKMGFATLASFSSL